ncbi:hypothetical protein JX265_001165 [Neoarthrinium moseri]|uniref:YTH domain-containing protein n=1 Tax=Neoarthrinium moseri TaxID=1658444 RepID=A0A9P9WXA2_9PEZI|nr:hypothetical protein JX265_001165 [Neoarthrinium moseri]
MEDHRPRSDTAHDPDFEDWLTFTGWHDVNFRHRKLEYFRDREAMEQQRAIWTAREARVRDFEQNYGTAHEIYRPHVMLPSTENDSSAGDGYGPDTTDPGTGNEVRHHRRTSQGENQSTPPYDDGSNATRIVTPQPPEPAQLCTPYTGHRAARFSDSSRTIGRGRSRSPVPSAQLRNHRYGIINGGLYAQHREYRERSLGSHPSQELELGKNGDTRFFVIRSYNIDNIRACIQEGIWATKPANAGKLCEAFNSCKNVVLTFGANSSHAFQGYARMISLPSADVPKPSWYHTLRWAKSEPFRVEWILTKSVVDSHVRGLKNPLNEDLPITRSRDCQELDDCCGRDLLNILQREATKASK